MECGEDLIWSNAKAAYRRQGLAETEPNPRAIRRWYCKIKLHWLGDEDILRLQGAVFAELKAFRTRILYSFASCLGD